MEVVIEVVCAVSAQVMFYFIQKALDKWSNSHFPPSNESMIQ